MEFVIYSRPFCTFCDKAKDLLRSKHLSFHEYVVGVDISREELIAKFPDAKTLPIILRADGPMVGGFNELSDHLRNK